MKNGANQLVKAGNQDYLYDENGNLQFDGNKSYVFNAFNQLEEIKDTAGNTIASYTYDEEGKRITSNTYEGIVNFFYDGDTVLYSEQCLSLFAFFVNSIHSWHNV